MANFEDRWAESRGCGRELALQPRMVGDKWFLGGARDTAAKAGQVLKLGHVPKDFMPNPVHDNSSFLERRWRHQLQRPADTDPGISLQPL